MCEIPLLVMIHYKLRRLFLCSGGGYKHKRFLRQSWAYWSFRCCELVNSNMRATEVVRSEAMELELLQRWGHFKTAQKKYPPCPDKLSTGEGACSSAVSLAPAWHCVTLRDDIQDLRDLWDLTQHFSISQAQAPAAVLDTIWYGRNIFTISM